MKSLVVVSLAASLSAACAFALGQGAYGDPHAPIAGQVLEMIIHTKDAEELRYVILRKLTDQYAEEKGIKVTQAEKDAYTDSVRQSMEQDRQQRMTRGDALARKLREEGLPQAEREALAAELEMLDELAASLEEVADPAAEDSEEVKARDEAASAVIGQWKLNRALYQDYGGRIIFQQGGPEPLDAYRRFLEERQAQGAFRIFDRDIESAFWGYYVTDAIHSFYTSGSAEEASAFRTSWWLSE